MAVVMFGTLGEKIGYLFLVKRRGVRRRGSILGWYRESSTDHPHGDRPLNSMAKSHSEKPAEEFSGADDVSLSRPLVYWSNAYHLQNLRQPVCPLAKCPSGVCRSLLTPPGTLIGLRCLLCHLYAHARVHSQASACMNARMFLQKPCGGWSPAKTSLRWIPYSPARAYFWASLVPVLRPSKI